MKKEKAYSLRTSFVTSYTRMCIHLSTAHLCTRYPMLYSHKRSFYVFLAFCFGVS